MPLLRPKKYEKNKDFIQRCMGNAKMGEEFPIETSVTVFARQSSKTNSIQKSN